MRYNYTIIDLYDRSIISTINGDHITTELAYLFDFKTKFELDTAVTNFAYGWYNRVRPHTYNEGLTPAAARVA